MYIPLHMHVIILRLVTGMEHDIDQEHNKGQGT